MNIVIVTNLSMWAAFLGFIKHSVMFDIVFDEQALSMICIVSPRDHHRALFYEYFSYVRMDFYVDLFFP